MPEYDGMRAVFSGWPSRMPWCRGCVGLESSGPLGWMVHPSLSAPLPAGLLRTSGRTHVSASSIFPGLLRGLGAHRFLCCSCLAPYLSFSFPLSFIAAHGLCSPNAESTGPQLPPGSLPWLGAAEGLLVSGFSPEGRAPGRSPSVGKQPPRCRTVWLAGVPRLSIHLVLSSPVTL